MLEHIRSYHYDDEDGKRQTGHALQGARHSVANQWGKAHKALQEWCDMLIETWMSRFRITQSLSQSYVGPREGASEVETNEDETTAWTDEAEAKRKLCDLFFGISDTTTDDELEQDLKVLLSSQLTLSLEHTHSERLSTTQNGPSREPIDDIMAMSTAFRKYNADISKYKRIFRGGSLSYDVLAKRVVTESGAPAKRGPRPRQRAETSYGSGKKRARDTHFSEGDEAATSQSRGSKASRGA
jgi:hypothetical protein